jgi:hypothetical protein
MNQILKAKNEKKIQIKKITQKNYLSKPILVASATL